MRQSLVRVTNLFVFTAQCQDLIEASSRYMMARTSVLGAEIYDEVWQLMLTDFENDRARYVKRLFHVIVKQPSRRLDFFPFFLFLCGFVCD